MNLDERIEAWLDGSLDDAGCAELARLVQIDPSVAARLADATRMDLALGVAHGHRPDLAAGVVAGLRGSESRQMLRQSVMRALPRRRRPAASTLPLWLALAAAAAVVIAILLTQMTDPPVPAPRTTATAQTQTAPLGEVVSASTPVLVRRAGEDRAATPGLRLEAGDRIQVPPDGAAVITACAARLELGPASELSVDAVDAIGLSAGSLRATVEPRRQAPALVFTTPQAQATVLGTVLTLAIGDGKTRLAVERGRVSLMTRGRPTALEVGSGEAADVRPGADPVLALGERPLFTADLVGWSQMTGTWAWQGEVLRGGHDQQPSRLMSERSFGDFILDCLVRVDGNTTGAEIQADDYRWFVRVPRPGGWHRVRLSKLGGQRSALIDGQPAEILWGGSGAPELIDGPISFYVRDGGRLEIRAARIATAP